ncbi:peptide chain release factor N(5)-glutamine methyltransferase [Erythrobacter sp. EC-HK427]|uniref:peptide chain release factor N(5)-glutamine methyltransferase n=1 Tax=Erythrobacter sp. EC-HK427 TaxID=2038396 RepID=UPI001254260A|nr:peptide chain release factor N(5)-glutamine methyltransferase [Erythrobacter sp. EC-HK427]VVT05191.1 Release factor glutamine methyltransferase [Erythrobacter sp. EC-HK427]
MAKAPSSSEEGVGGGGHPEPGAHDSTTPPPPPLKRRGSYVAQAIREATTKLATTSDTARLDAELLMAHALGVSRSDLLLRHMQDAVPPAFAALVERRAAQKPLAYIIGTQEFFGRSFLVTSDVLIPRADSESVVEAALAAAPEAKRILDCGTGSGALLLTLLAEVPAAEGVGIDASMGAIAVAAANAGLLGLAERARILHADWTQNGWAKGHGRFDLIIANPPYVETGADLAPDVRGFEPASALFAGPEGLNDYRILLPQLPDLLTENGVAVLEIGYLQAAAVTQIAEKQGFSVEVKQDLGQRDRALVLRIKLGKGESTG